MYMVRKVSKQSGRIMYSTGWSIVTKKDARIEVGKQHESLDHSKYRIECWKQVHFKVEV